MEIEFDDRMTEETKQYLAFYFQKTRPTDILRADLGFVRKIRDDFAKSMNHLFKFEETLDIEDIFVKNTADDYDIRVRKYVPKNVNRSTTSITVFMHGGGYTIGSVETHHQTVALLALKSNTIWLSIDYRLCPENKYPIPFEDCRSVLEWVLNNKDKIYSGSATIGISGDSSGGQIAAVLAHRYKKELSHQILIYPVVSDHGNFPSYKEFTKECYLLVPEVLEFFFKNIGVSPLDLPEYFSALSIESFENLPKCLLIAVELDPMVDESKFYYEKLSQKNINCRFEILNGVVHGYFSLPLAFKEAFEKTENLVTEFLNNVN